eukprot:s5821_g3.t1
MALASAPTPALTLTLAPAGRRHVRQGWSRSTHTVRAAEGQEAAAEQGLSVAVVGAGPVGLLTALALARRGFRKVRVLDRLPEPPSPDAAVWGDPDRSYNLGIGGRGQRALAKFGALERVDRWSQTELREMWPDVEVQFSKECTAVDFSTPRPRLSLRNCGAQEAEEGCDAEEDASQEMEARPFQTRAGDMTCADRLDVLSTLITETRRFSCFGSLMSTLVDLTINCFGSSFSNDNAIEPRPWGASLCSAGRGSHPDSLLARLEDLFVQPADSAVPFCEPGFLEYVQCPRREHGVDWEVFLANACENCQPDELCSFSHGDAALQLAKHATSLENHQSFQCAPGILSAMIIISQYFLIEQPSEDLTQFLGAAASLAPFPFYTSQYSRYANMVPVNLLMCNEEQQQSPRAFNRFVPRVHAEDSGMCGMVYTDDQLVRRCRAMRRNVGVPDRSSTVIDHINCPASTASVDEELARKIQKYSNRANQLQCQDSRGMWNEAMSDIHKCAALLEMQDGMFRRPLWLLSVSGLSPTGRFDKCWHNLFPSFAVLL